MLANGTFELDGIGSEIFDPSKFYTKSTELKTSSNSIKKKKANHLLFILDYITLQKIPLAVPINDYSTHDRDAHNI